MWGNWRRLHSVVDVHSQLFGMFIPTTGPLIHLLTGQFIQQVTLSIQQCWKPIQKLDSDFQAVHTISVGSISLQAVNQMNMYTRRRFSLNCMWTFFSHSCILLSTLASVIVRHPIQLCIQRMQVPVIVSIIWQGGQEAKNKPRLLPPFLWGCVWRTNVPVWRTGHLKKLKNQLQNCNRNH